MKIKILFFFCVLLFIFPGCGKIDLRLLDGRIDNTRHYSYHYATGQMMVQWTTPFAIETKAGESSLLVWGWTGEDGSFGVSSYDDITKIVSNTQIGYTSSKDMHNSPAIIELSDGRIGVVSCHGHDNFAKVWVYRSKDISSIDSFDGPVEISGWIGNTTYTQIHQIDGMYYIFVRTCSSKYGWVWQLSYSRDFVNWSVPQAVVISRTSQYYCRFVNIEGENDLLRIVMYSNPNYPHTEIRHGYFNIKTGSLYSGKSMEIIGNVYQDNPVDFSRFEVIIDKPSQGGQRLFDVACTNKDDVVVSYSRWTTAYDSEYFLYNNGEEIKVCNGGEAYLHARAQLGMRFISDNTVAAARNEDGFDYLEIYQFSGTSITPVSLVDKVSNGNNHYRLNMPMSDENGHYLFYARGTFNTTDYTDFNSDIVFVKLSARK